MTVAPQVWTPVALAADIPAGTSAGVVCDGAELVIWRDTAGRLAAWEDRCPHRGMKLSFGFVRGDRLACLYHGWQYDGTGVCRHIPAHPDLDVPATIRVQSYRTAQAWGMVWVSAGDGDAPSGEATPVRSLFVAAPLARVVAALDAGFPGAGPMGAVTQSPGLIRFDQGPHRFVVGAHGIGPDNSALHIAVEAAGGQLDTVIPATAALRRQAEAMA